MQIKVRKARSTDAGSLLGLTRRAFAEPNNFLVTTVEEFTNTVDDERRFIVEHVNTYNSTLLLAEVAGKLVGMVICRGGNRIATRHTTILGITVDQDWRDFGIGSLLMQQAIDWAKQTNLIRRIELNVFAHNERAIHVYQKFGFQIEGRRQRAYFKDGQFMDDLLMALLI